MALLRHPPSFRLRDPWIHERVRTQANALRYEHRRVVERYCETFAASPAEGALLFMDVKRWLWSCFWLDRCKRARPDDPSLPTRAMILASQWRLDEMWHCFILFTRDYERYCWDSFGRFLHHDPGTDDDPGLAKADFDAELYKLMSFVYDQWGPAVTERWYGHFDAHSTPIR